jgi:hypothetical protein
METKELLEGIKEQVLLIEAEIDKTTAASKGRCRSAANKIKNLSADFKRTQVKNNTCLTNANLPKLN